MTAVMELNVKFDAEGFMTDPNEWTPEIAEVLAKEEGIDDLTDRQHQRTLRALSQRPSQEGCPYCRAGEAQGLHLVQIGVNSCTSSETCGVRYVPIFQEAGSFLEGAIREVASG